MCWRRCSGFDMLYEATCAVMQQVASALSQVHQNELAHGDVKAGNVFVALEQDPNGYEELVAKLGDFGCAKASLV
jgi:serine/threonine protein kinase